ncbi:uncharacterized protein [Rutidosis leptorrhynchoides]|uniref:uncharacterized protein n=1 Tax=Rutidosis leptorrhynchoides TaxID=125765 RepID=UPI003A98DA0A
MEKFVCALLLTLRRLRGYFQGLPIHVLTDLPVKHVLNKPEISGRLAKWAIELGSYEITYLPRTSMKGQVLADYLSEMMGELEVIHERTTLKPVQEGAGAGLVLTSPSGEEHTYALRFNFDVTNNEAEYEALLAGLNIVHKMNITKLRAYVNSQLVSNQFNGSFDAHELSMHKYLKLLKEAAEKFEHFELAQFSRSKNKKADGLSKLASLIFSHFQRQVWVEELSNKAIDGGLIFAAIEEAQPNWMNPIIENLRNNTLPEDKNQTRLVRMRSPMYITENDILYLKSYYGPLMRCVGPAEAEMIIKEVHNGSCSLHSGYKTIASKIMWMGYFWPTLYRDVAKIVKRCKRLFPAGAGNVKFLIVAIDYFTKWVKEKALRTITAVQRLNEKRTGWVDELSNVLWAHRTTFKRSTGEIPFSLVYGSEAMIPAEILVPTHRVANFDESANNDTLCEN